MFGDHLPDQLVVHPDKREVTLEVGRAQFDRGQPRRGNHLGHFLRERAAEDAVTIPVFQPRRRTGLQRAQLNEARPGAVGRYVAPHAGEQFARVCARGFDEKRDAGWTATAGGHKRRGDEKPEVR